MTFLYSLLLKLLSPISPAVLLLLASAVLRRRHSRSVSSPGGEGRGEVVVPASGLRPLSSDLCSRACFWLAVAVLLVCGNGWVVKYSTRYLESQYPPLDYQLSTLNSQPATADCILVLGGGVLARVPPRPTVEVAEAGDRVLYAAYLFRHGCAPSIVCSDNDSTGSMAELLKMIGVPQGAIILETKSENTHGHGVNLYSLLQDRGFKRVLLVTSAMHMPRSMGVFKRFCAGVEFIPAPTDFRIIRLEIPWYQELLALIPTPANLEQFSETMHEYLGIAYYKMRGWM